jgi:hypothetical protein
MLQVVTVVKSKAEALEAMKKHASADAVYGQV